MSLNLEVAPNATPSPHHLQRPAKIAGLLYLLWFPLGIFGILYVPSVVVVPGDIATTASNIVANEPLYRLSIVTALLSGIVGIFLALLLYRVFYRINHAQASMMAVFLLVAIPVALFNEVMKFGPLLLLTDPAFSNYFTLEQIHALSTLFLNLHEHGIAISGVFWGLWLFPLGILVYRSQIIPRILGILLLVAGLGYVIDSMIFFLLPTVSMEFAPFMFWGELFFPLWLLIKGVDNLKPNNEVEDMRQT